MNPSTDILHEAKRMRLLAAALELQHFTRTESNIVPIPGGDRVIAIGAPAQVRGLLADAALADDVVAFGASLLGHASTTEGMDEEEARAWVRARWAEWTGCTVVEAVLTDAEYAFVDLVRQRPGHKLNGPEVYDADGNPLWKRPEELRLIRAIGCFKWIVSGATPRNPVIEAVHGTPVDSEGGHHD